MTATCFIVELELDWEGWFSPVYPPGYCLDGRERNVNIPWATKGMGDGDYIFAFQQIVMPIAHEFDPDLVIGMSSYLLWMTLVPTEAL